MVTQTRKASLSPARRRLLELLQQVNFGRIDCLAIVGGDPVFDPPPRLVREIKFGGENGPRPELGSPDFLLKSQVVELLAFLDEFQNGTVDVLEVKHGLPFRVIVTEVPA
ncbi:MAG: hypothetical protein NTW96_25610 [Planctomycetia bacterium]|nr:hypothetical protein [Planctomycetia bacterium]